MSVLAKSLRRIVTDLTDLGVSWALVGGLAVSARAEPRTTRDVDAVVAVGSNQEAEKVIFDLQSRGYRTITVLEQKEAARLATVRLVPPAEGFGAVLDLLFASSGLEVEIAAAAERLEILPSTLEEQR